MWFTMMELLKTVSLLSMTASSCSEPSKPTSTRWAADLSPTCNRFGFLASRGCRRLVGERCRSVPKSSRMLKLPNLLSSRRRSPVVFVGTRDNRTPYAVDKTGGGRSSAISRKTSAKRVLGITTSAI